MRSSGPILGLVFAYVKRNPFEHLLVGKPVYSGHPEGVIPALDGDTARAPPVLVSLSIAASRILWSSEEAPLADMKRYTGQKILIGYLIYRRLPGGMVAGAEGDRAQKLLGGYLLYRRATGEFVLAADGDMLPKKLLGGYLLYRRRPYKPVHPVEGDPAERLLVGNVGNSRQAKIIELGTAFGPVEGYPFKLIGDLEPLYRREPDWGRCFPSMASMPSISEPVSLSIAAARTVYRSPSLEPSGTPSPAPLRATISSIPWSVSLSTAASLTALLLALKGNPRERTLIG